MTYKYTGVIFKIPFPFTDLSEAKARPAMALSEPDQYGDMAFAFITTKQSRGSEYTLDIPHGLLPFASHLHIDKVFLLNKKIILKEIVRVDGNFLEQVLKHLTLMDTKRYYENIHHPVQQQPFIPGKSRINYAGRVFDKSEICNLMDSSLEFWLTYGRYSKEFEKRLAEFLGIKYAFLVNSGSSANLLAFMALTSPLLKDRAVKRGDEVITVAAGFPTTVSPIIQYGAVPVFVDVTLDTLNIDITHLESAVSDKTKAVMLAHTLGNPFNIQAIKTFCKKHNLWLIEDNCDALGSQYLSESNWPPNSTPRTQNPKPKTQLTGTFGDIATSSFYPPHHMTTGEGGAVYTNDKLLKKIILSMRDWGRDCWCDSGKDNTCGCRFSKQYGSLPYGYDHKYVYSHFGYNLKPSDMQAAIGCAQLDKLEIFTAKRRENFQTLREGLADLTHIFHLPQATQGSDPSWFGFFLTLKDGVPFTRNQIVEHLEAANIQTRNLVAGNITCHPCFMDLEEGRDFRIARELVVTDKIMNDGFWIGVYPGMAVQAVQYMIDTIRTFVETANL
jgi:CDP-6-deoxy-D-xylo-4-hexulose-3-dehydrase